MAEEVVRFDVTFSVEDVLSVQKALMKRFKAGKDEPIKTVGLALCVAEIEVMMWKRMMAEHITNGEEVIEGIRDQALETALDFYKARRPS